MFIKRNHYINKENISFKQIKLTDDAISVAQMIQERFPNLNGKVNINHVGTTVGSHTGPGTVALFYYGK